MITLMAAALVIGALIIWDYVRRSAVARVGATLLAVSLLLFSAPKPYRALRRAADLPPEERVAVNLWTKKPATEFESGMFTLYQKVVEDFEIDRQWRQLGVGVLVVLALTPIVRRRPRA